MGPQTDGTSNLDQHNFENKQREISLLIASSKESTAQQRWPNNLQIYRGQLSSRSRQHLVPVKIYFSPQYDQQLFVSLHFLGQSTSALKPSPRRR